MEKINFSNGEKISAAKVTIDSVDYEVTPAEYDGATPLNATVFNNMQENIEDAIDTKANTSDVYTKQEVDNLIPTKAHQVNVGTEVDEEYRVNLLKTKNLTYIDAESKTLYNVTFTNNGNGTMKMNGTASANIYFKIISKINLIAGITYTLSTNITTSSNIFFYSNDYAKVGLNYDDLKLSSGTSKTFTPTISGSIDLILYIYTGTSVNSTIQVQVEEGSTATEYTPFINNQINVDNEKYSDTINVGAIEDSRSRVNVLHSKNLYIPFKGTQTQNGITITGNADGSATISGTATANSDIYSAGGPDTYAPINLENGYYTISGAPNQSGSTYQLFAVFKDSSNNTKIMISGQTDLLTNIVGVRFFVRSFNGANINTTIYPMANEGTTVLPFEPYVVPSIKVDNEEIYRKPKVLWENPSITSDFSNQTITLNDSLENYDYYEVIFLMSKYEQLALSSGLIPSSMSTSITTIRLAGGTGIIARYRDISRNSATTLAITKASKISGSSTTITEEVDRVIPYRIIGH